MATMGVKGLSWQWCHTGYSVCVL